MAIREIDAISDAIIETEREIAGSAWDQEETERDESGRDLEEMGDGLEGQQEAGDDVDADGEEADGDDEAEGEGEGEAADAEAAAAAAAAATGKGKEGEGEKPEAGRAERPEGRVPSGKLREANAARAAAEAERDRLAQELEAAKKVPDNRTEIDTLKTQVSALTQLLQGQRQPPKAEVEAPKVAPDIFEDPKGFVEFITQGFQSELSKRDTQLENNRVETSMAIAHAFHKDTFEKAFGAINKLDPTNPDDRMTVQRIYKSPNPGEALVNWHKRSETLARVGNDPAKFEERIRAETREALLKDPEFRKALVAEMRGEAQRPGPDGNPRTTTRLPTSLNRASGSNLGAERNDTRGGGDDEQAVADAAWR